MGRYYKTAEPDFSKDFVYQPPWEMMVQAAQMKQNQYDKTVAETGVFDDLLKIKHRDDDVENSNVAAVKDYYEAEVEDITNQLKTGGPSNELNRRMKQLQKDISQDREDGNIAKFENNYAMYQKHLNALSEAEKSGEDIDGARARFSKYDNSWKGNENRSMDSIMGYEELIKRPELLDAENMVDLMKNVPEYKNSNITKMPDGKGYLVEKEGTVTEVTPEQLLQTAMPALMSDPSLKHWAKQRQDLGLGQFYNEDDSFMNPAFEEYYDAKGQSISEQEYNNLNDGERSKGIGFANNEIGNSLRLAASLESRDSKKTLKYSGDSNFGREDSQKHAIGMQEDRQAHAKEMLGLKNKNDLEKMALEGNEDAVAQLQAEFGFNSFAQIQNKAIPDMFGIAKNGNFDEAGKDKLNTIFKDLTKGLKGQDLENYKGLQEAFLNKEVTTPKEANAYLFKSKYPTVEDFINDNTGLSAEDIQKAKQQGLGGVYTLETKDGLQKSIDTKDILKYEQYYQTLQAGEDATSYFGLVNHTDEVTFKEFESFSGKAKAYLDQNYNKANTVKEFENVPVIAGKALAGIVNENRADMTFIDLETNEVIPNGYLPDQFVSSTGVSGASGAGTTHVMVQGDDGKKYVAYSPSGEGVSPAELAIRNISVQSLKDGSSTKEELKSYTRSNVSQQFQEAKRSNIMGQEIVIEDKFYGTGSKLTKLGNGVNASYEVSNPRFGSKRQFSTEDEFYTYLENMAKIK